MFGRPLSPDGLRPSTAAPPTVCPNCGETLVGQTCLECAEEEQRSGPNQDLHLLISRAASQAALGGSFLLEPRFDSPSASAASSRPPSILIPESSSSRGGGNVKDSTPVQCVVLLESLDDASAPASMPVEKPT